jgi:hypothetical protein
MGAWDDLRVDPSRVRGLAETIFTDRQSGTFDAGEAAGENAATAKGELQDVLLHPEYGGLAEHVDDAGGPQALLDALASDDQLKGRLKRGHALAVVALHATDDAVLPDGRTQQRGTGARERLREWAQSFGQIAPYQLGYTTTSTGGIGGSVTNTYDRYDT